MKILYAIQGTGNGHVSRAREIIPHLKQHGEVDLLVSGTQADVGLDDEVKYQLHGFGFVFGKSGGVDFLESWKQFDFRTFIKDCRNLPVHDYDYVISDFEPVSAWACKFRKKKCIALSHQSAYISKKTPQLKGFHWGKIIMNNYAPADQHIAFHFEKYDDFIHFPVIRSEIRQLSPKDLGHYVVYLPAYSDDFILKQLKKFPEKNWKVFSKHSKQHYVNDHVEVFPVDNKLFQHYLETSSGILTGGGFEGPAESLFLGKKVLSVPMKNQYEQQCNALSLEKMGVPVIWNENEFQEKISSWIQDENRIIVNYPDETAEIIAAIFRKP